MAIKKITKAKTVKKIDISKLKPSELIRVAVDDLTKAEKSKKYEVDMNQWHYKPQAVTEPCQVCFAGSVIAFSLDSPKVSNLNPDDFEDNTRNALQALNEFREGQVGDAFSYLHRAMPKFVADFVSVVDYDVDPQLFKSQMLQLANVLAATGN